MEPVEIKRMKYSYPAQIPELYQEIANGMVIDGTVFVVYTWDNHEFFAEILPPERVKIDDTSPPPSYRG